MAAISLPLLHLWNFKSIESKLSKAGKWVKKFNWPKIGSPYQNRKLSIAVPSVCRKNDPDTSSTTSLNPASPEITTIPMLARFINPNPASAKKAEKTSSASKAGGRKVAAKN